jgi:cupin superfamily acireductone dioxygenase involved in methionine salvage
MLVSSDGGSNADNVRSAVEWALKNDRKMNDKDRKSLTVQLLWQRNQYWNGPTEFDNLTKQEGYQTVHRVVNILSSLVDGYRENLTANFLGEHGVVTYAFMKKEIDRILARKTVAETSLSVDEDQLPEHFWLERLEPIVTKHMTTEMMNTSVYGHSALCGANHLNWLIERNNAFLRQHFYVDWAGDPFVKMVNDVERRMLTLFAKDDMPKSKCVNFLYTGRLIDSVMYADGRYKHLAVHCLDGRDLWTIPPEEFNMDNRSVVHPAHLIHQPEDYAHFNISKHGRMVYIQQIKGWKKDQRLFLNYGHDGDKLWDHDYVQLKNAEWKR